MSSLSRHNSFSSATDRSLLTQQNEWQRPQLPVRLSVSNPPPTLSDLTSHSHSHSHAALNALQQQEQGQQQRRKKKSKVGAVKAKAKVQQLPPLDWQLAERRIDELHKVAAGARALHMHTLSHTHAHSDMGISLSPRPALVGPEGAGFSPRSAAPRARETERDAAGEMASLTGTEAEFLVRQIQSGGADDLSQLSLLSNHDELRALSQGMGLDIDIGADIDARTIAHIDARESGGVSEKRSKEKDSAAATAASVVGEALRNKIAALEKQLISLNATVQRKEQELEKKDQRVRSLVKENEKLRAEKETEIRRMQAEHQRELLVLQDKHSKEKAALFSSSIGTEAHNSMPSTVDSSSCAAPTQQIEAYRRTLAQLDRERATHREREATFEAERKALEREHASRLLSLERALSSDVKAAKAELLRAEDQIAALQESLRESERERETLLCQQRVWEDAKRAAQAEKEKLRAELQMMQQAVAGSYRLDSSVNKSMAFSPSRSVSDNTHASQQSLTLTQGQQERLPADIELSQRLREAQNDAKLKQVLNKLDFLKAQLESEKRINDELREVLQEREKELLTQREETDRRVRETMREAEKRMQQREQDIKQDYESRMSELTTLQRNMLALRSEREERERESLQLRQREESLSAQLQRISVALTAQKSECESLSAQLQTLQREREEEQRAGNKLSQEAVLRRLDNERHYLKSQLSAEIALKSEMQTALTRTQAQLTESQRQWREDVHTLKETISRMQRESDDAHTLRESEKIREERERAHLTQNLQDLKDGFVKVRDTLRAEQLRLETLTLEKARLSEEKEALSRDLSRLKEREQERLHEQKEREQEQQTLWEATQNAHSQELQRLRDELQKQHLCVAQGAVELLRERDAHEGERQTHARAIAALRMNDAFFSMSRKRVFRALCAWRMRTALLSVGAQVKAQVSALLIEKEKENVREKERALRAQQEELRAKFDGERAELLRESEAQRERLRERMERESEEVLQAEREKHAAALRQCEEDCVYDVQNERREREKERERLLAERESERERLNALLQQTVQRVEREKDREKESALQALREDLLTTHTQSLAGRDKEQEKEKQRMRSDFSVALHNALIQRDAEHAAEREKELSEWAAERVRERALWQTEREKEMESERARQTQREKVLREEWETQTHAHCEALQRQWREEEEMRVRALRSEWESERELEKEEERVRLREEKERELVLWRAESESEREKAVKREANKWRQVVRDCDAQREIESSQSALAERERCEKEFALERERLQNELSLAVQRERDLAAAQNVAMLRDIERTREREREQLLKEKEEELRKFSDKMHAEMERERERAIEKERERLTTVHERDIASERERQNALRRDFSAQTSQFAAERERLMGEIARVEKEKDLLSEERESERLLWEKERESERALFDAQLDAALQQERERVEREQERERAAMREEQERVVSTTTQRERENAQRELEKERQAMSEENERLVTQLEQTLQSLKEEKLSLSQSLDTLSERLTDSEDALYDARQKEKTLSKELSIARWQAATKLFTLQTRAQTKLKERDERNERALRECETMMQEKWDTLCLSLLQALRALQTVEEQRLTAWQSLTQHRVEDLKSMKKRVSALEGELQRVSLEKEALEEQRASLLEEIERCGEEVKEQEALAREHTQESSMTANGRVNVAHARKKKRLDQEIERLLEAMEDKRSQIGDIENRIAQKQAQREEKESELMDVEKELVGILIEQQRLALKATQEMAGAAEKAKLVASAQRLPFPLSAQQHVSPALLEELKKQWRREDEK